MHLVARAASTLEAHGQHRPRAEEPLDALERSGCPQVRAVGATPQAALLGAHVDEVLGGQHEAGRARRRPTRCVPLSAEPALECSASGRGR